MKAYSFFLQKGGVGKSTLSVSAACSISQKHKTIFVDGDPQGNSSAWLLGDTPVNNELADILYGRLSVKDGILNVYNGFDILPTFGVDGDLAVYGDNQLKNEPLIFIDLLGELEALGYEAAIFDLGPGFGQLNKSVLMALTETVLIMTPDVFSLDGLETVRREIAKIERGFKRSVHYKRLVVNSLNRTIGQHMEIYREAQKAPYEVFTIGVDPVFRKAQAENVPAQYVSGKDKMKSETRAEIERLAAALMGG